MKSQILKWLAGAAVLGVFWLIGETASQWISSRDTVTDPLHKRIFHLMLLVGFAGLVLALTWLILKYFGYFN